MNNNAPIKLTDNLNRCRRRIMTTSTRAATARSSVLTRPNSICLTDCSASASFDDAATTASSSSGAGCLDDFGIVMTAPSSSANSTSAATTYCGHVLDPTDEHRLKLLESNFNQISIGTISIYMAFFSLLTIDNLIFLLI